MNVTLRLGLAACTGMSLTSLLYHAELGLHSPTWPLWVTVILSVIILFMTRNKLT